VVCRHLILYSVLKPRDQGNSEGLSCHWFSLHLCASLYSGIHAAALHACTPCQLLVLLVLVLILVLSLLLFLFLSVALIVPLSLSLSISLLYLFVITIVHVQRHGVVIETCMVGTSDSAFLQQAAHITEGLYLWPRRTGALLQYLLVSISDFSLIEYIPA